MFSFSVFFFNLERGAFQITSFLVITVNQTKFNEYLESYRKKTVCQQTWKDLNKCDSLSDGWKLPGIS